MSKWIQEDHIFRAFGFEVGDCVSNDGQAEPFVGLSFSGSYPGQSSGDIVIMLSDDVLVALCQWAQTRVTKS